MTSTDHVSRLDGLLAGVTLLGWTLAGLTILAAMLFVYAMVATYYRKD